MINEEIKNILEIAYTKNWDDFFTLFIILYFAGGIIFYYGWFCMPIILTYVLYMPPFILGVLSFMIYVIFTKIDV